MFAKNTASSTTSGQRDDTLDRSYDYDHLGRLIVSHSGYEARLHMSRQQPGDPTTYGPYSQVYGYDQLGNMTTRYGWGGWDAGYVNWAPSYTNNRMTTNPATGAAMVYDAGGNLTNDGYQTYSYDATGQQSYASGTALTQSYDGNGVRAKKTDNGATTYYLRSSVLGGQVVAEMDGNGTWARGYVYLGGQMLAIQSAGVSWVHQDPVTKSQRITNSSGTVTSTIDLDPWGGETAVSSNQAFQPHRYTTYERDGNSGDDAMMRRYTGKWHRFDQPDPYNGSYDMADPQSFNRYSYVQNDPVNFVDPSGLNRCWDILAHEWFDCPDIDPEDVVHIYTSASLFGSYFLPASQSGHSPLIIGLLRGDPNTNPVSPLSAPQTPPSLPPATGYTCATISGGKLLQPSVGAIVDSNFQVFPTLGIGGSIGLPLSYTQTYGSGPVYPGLYLYGTASSGLAVTHTVNIFTGRVSRDVGGGTPTAGSGFQIILPALPLEGTTQHDWNYHPDNPNRKGIAWSSVGRCPY